jgi:hypothetical protein
MLEITMAALLIGYFAAIAIVCLASRSFLIDDPARSRQPRKTPNIAEVG